MLTMPADTSRMCDRGRGEHHKSMNCRNTFRVLHEARVESKQGMEGGMNCAWGECLQGPARGSGRNYNRKVHKSHPIVERLGGPLNHEA